MLLSSLPTKSTLTTLTTSPSKTRLCVKTNEIFETSLIDGGCIYNPSHLLAGSTGLVNSTGAFFLPSGDTGILDV